MSERLRVNRAMVRAALVTGVGATLLGTAITLFPLTVYGGSEHTHLP